MYNSTRFNLLKRDFFCVAQKSDWRRCDCRAHSDFGAFLFASMKGGALSLAGHSLLLCYKLVQMLVAGFQRPKGMIIQSDWSN